MVIYMKTQIQISNHINELVVKMEDTKHFMDHGATNLIFHMEHKRELMSIATEIRHLCWAIDEDVPNHIFDLL